MGSAMKKHTSLPHCDTDFIHHALRLFRERGLTPNEARKAPRVPRAWAERHDSKATLDLKLITFFLTLTIDIADV